MISSCFRFGGGADDLHRSVDSRTRKPCAIGFRDLFVWSWTCGGSRRNCFSLARGDLLPHHAPNLVPLEFAGGGTRKIVLPDVVTKDALGAGDLGRESFDVE